jgi:hypothetical protein
VSQRSVAEALAKCGLPHWTFATSKSPKYLASGRSGTRVPHGIFEWPYATFLFRSAAQAAFYADPDFGLAWWGDDKWDRGNPLIFDIQVGLSSVPIERRLSRSTLRRERALCTQACSSQLIFVSGQRLARTIGAALRVCSALISYAVKCIARNRKRRVNRPAKALHGPDHRKKGRADPSPTRYNGPTREGRPFRLGQDAGRAVS